MYIGTVIGLINYSMSGVVMMKVFNNKGIATTTIIVIIAVTIIILVGVIGGVIGYNMYVGEELTGDDSGLLSQITEENVDVEQVCYTPNGILVVKITNNNSKEICLSSVSAIYKDSDGNVGLTCESTVSNIVIPAHSYIMTTFDMPANKDYKNYSDLTFSKQLAGNSPKFTSENIDVSYIDTGKKIAITLKNNTGEIIGYPKAHVFFYRGNEIVGMGVAKNKDDDDVLTPNGSEEYLNLKYIDESSKSSEKLEFDRYEIYFLGAEICQNTEGSWAQSVSKDNILIEPMDYISNNSGSEAALALKIVNNNNQPVYISHIIATYKDKNGVFGFRSKTGFIYVPANSSTVTSVKANSKKETYEEYPDVTFRIEFAPDVYDPFLANAKDNIVEYTTDGIEYSSVDTGKQIDITYKNNTEKAIRNTGFKVLFYKDGKIVKISSISDPLTFQPGESNTVHCAHSNTAFDRYEVYCTASDKTGYLMNK